MSLQYFGLHSISGSLIVLDHVEGAKFDEMARIVLDDGTERTGRVAMLEGDKAILQVFEGTHGLSLTNTRTQFTGRPMEMPLSEDLFGRVFTGAGRPADGLGEVPAEIRRYNLRLVAGIILLLGLCFLLHRPIISLITGIGRGLRMLIRALFALITKLIAWLGGNAPEELPPAEGGVPGGDAPLPADSNPLWNLLWIPVLLLFIYILRPLLSELADSIREILMRISAKLHSRGGTVREIIPESGEFTDTETVSLPEEHAESRRAGRKWNKAVRAWERLPDNAEKFYAGYRLLMQAPAWETRPAAADTALEICEKWKQQSGSGLTPVTDALHAERYAAQGLPDDAIREMKQALTMLGNAAEKARRNDAGDAPRKGQ